MKRKRTPTLTSPSFPSSSSTNSVDQILTPTSLVPPGSGLGLMQPPVIAIPQHLKSESASHVPEPVDAMHIYSQRPHVLTHTAPFPTLSSTQIPGVTRHLSASSFPPNPAPAPSGPNLTYDAFWSSLSNSSHSGSAVLQTHRLGVRSSFTSTSSSQV